MTAPEIRGEHTTLRPVTNADLELLVAWFADPGVYTSWDGMPKSPTQVVAEGYTGNDRPATEPFIVEAAGEPIGYIQYCPDTATSGGIDLFLIPVAHRFVYLHEILVAELTGIGLWLDTSALSAEETVAAILHDQDRARLDPWALGVGIGR